VPSTYPLPGNLVSTYDIGFFPADTAVHHEDFTDVLTILDSFQTPAFSSFPKVRCRDVVHSWPVDTLAAPSTAGAPDGVDFNGDILTTPVRLFNGTQIFRRDVVVSDRERAANPAGIRDMYEHQIMKEFKVLARNAEYVLFKSTAVVSGAASAIVSGSESVSASNAPIMAGFRGFAISTAVVSGSNDVQLNDIIAMGQRMYINGAEPDSLWLYPQGKREFFNQVSASGGIINLRNIAADDRRIVANVDVFESPFGQLWAVIVDRFIPMSSAASTNAYFMGDRSMAKLAFFRPPQHKEMGKQGDNTRGLLLMELTLELAHPSAWGAVTAVTSTGAAGTPANLVT
jgi:hypothetical protein